MTEELVSKKYKSWFVRYKKKETNFEFYKDYELRFTVNGNKLSGYVDGKLLIETQDKDNSFESGMIGFIAQDGTLSSNSISIE